MESPKSLSPPAIEELCPHAIPELGNQCRLVYLAKCVLVAGDNTQDKLDRTRVGKVLRKMLDDASEPTCILEHCQGDITTSLLCSSLSPCCGEGIVEELLARLKSSDAPMTGHVPDFIVYLINSPGCIDKQQNRLNARAARKLELVISKMIPIVAECSPEGNKKLGDWVASICELASASAGMPAFISLMEKIIDVLFYRPYLAKSQMNVFFWVTDRAIWGRIFRSLWRHPRVCKGTMVGVVKLTMRLLDIEKRLFLSENRVGPKPISSEPPFSLHNLEFGGSDTRSLVEIVNKLVDSPPRSVTHDLELDDLEPQLRIGNGTPVESNTIIPHGEMATYFLWRNINCLRNALKRSLPFDLTTPVLDQFPVLDPSIPPSIVSGGSRNDAPSGDGVLEVEEGTLEQPRLELGIRGNI